MRLNFEWMCATSVRGGEGLWLTYMARRCGATRGYSYTPWCDVQNGLIDQ